MAGLKKKKREKLQPERHPEWSSWSPLFCAHVDRLGRLGLLRLHGQETLRLRQRELSPRPKRKKSAKLYYAMLCATLRQAIGQKLDAEEVQQLELDRDEFLKDNGPFNDEKSRDAAKAFMADVHESLGLPKDAKSYDKNYMDELKAAEDEDHGRSKGRPTPRSSSTRPPKSCLRS